MSPEETKEKWVSSFRHTQPRKLDFFADKSFGIRGRKRELMCTPMQQFGRKRRMLSARSSLLSTRAHSQAPGGKTSCKIIAVIHCKGHQKGQEEEAQGNRKADQEAK